VRIRSVKTESAKNILENQLTLTNTEWPKSQLTEKTTEYLRHRLTEWTDFLIDDKGECRVHIHKKEVEQNHFEVSLLTSIEKQVTFREF
jgi:hypothetical protein